MFQRKIPASQSSPKEIFPPLAHSRKAKSMTFPEAITHVFLCWSEAGNLPPTPLEQSGQPCKQLCAEPCCGHCLGKVLEGCQRGNNTKCIHSKVSSSLESNNSKRERMWSGKGRQALLLRPTFLAGSTGRVAHAVLPAVQGNRYVFTLHNTLKSISKCAMVWSLPQRKRKYSSCKVQVLS